MISQAIDQIISDQEARHSWIFEAGEQIRRWRREDMRANACGTGLGDPEGSEPDKPSPRFARHPISQERTDR